VLYAREFPTRALLGTDRERKRASRTGLRSQVTRENRGLRKGDPGVAG